MKTSRLLRLLTTAMLLLVATSAVAQDSYRQAVKDYLTAIDQFEKTKSIIATMSMLYESDGQVDINQLTSRYLDEQYENDLIDKYVDEMKISDMTEADLEAVASLLSSPEGKTFNIHKQKWIEALSANAKTPFKMMSDKVKKERIRAYEDGDWDGDIETLDLMGPPVEPRTDIDAAYVAKFNDVISGLDAIANTMMDEMAKRIAEDTIAYQTQEEREAIKDHMDKSMRALLLNSAYGILTLEDLDFAAKLHDNESYKKLNDPSKFAELWNNPDELEKLKSGNIMVKYCDWMEEHGAKVTEDPEAGLAFLKSMFEQVNLDFDDFFNSDSLNLNPEE